MTLQLFLRFDRFSLRQQPGRETLSFAYPLALDRSRFDDLLDARDSCQQCRIAACLERFLLGSALSKEVGPGKGPGEDTNAGENSDEGNDYSEISGLAHFTLCRCGELFFAVRGSAGKSSKTRYPLL
jgi:hypothetical protein